MSVLKSAASVVVAAAFFVFASGTSAQSQSHYTIQVCNDSSSDVLVALSYIPLGEGSWLNEGWMRLERNRCRVVGNTNNRYFYMYAERMGDSHSYWGGDNFLCVEYPGPYRFWNVSSMSCTSAQTSVGFRTLEANNFGTFTWRLTN